jgi:hypothetical protein
LVAEVLQGPDCLQSTIIQVCHSMAIQELLWFH